MMSSHVVGVGGGGGGGGGGGSSVISFLCSHTLHEHEGSRSSHGVRFSCVVSVVRCSLSSSLFCVFFLCGASTLFL